MDWKKKNVGYKNIDVIHVDHVYMYIYICVGISGITPHSQSIQSMTGKQRKM